MQHMEMPALTMGRCPFFPLWPYGRCEDRVGRTAGILVLLLASRQGRAWLTSCGFRSHAVRPMPINGALSLRPLFPLTGEEGGDTRESGVTQKPRLRLKRPIVFPMESRVWDLRFRGAEGICVSEARRAGQAWEPLLSVAGHSQDLSDRQGFPPLLLAEVKPGPEFRTRTCLGGDFKD